MIQRLEKIERWENERFAVLSALTKREFFILASSFSFAVLITLIALTYDEHGSLGCKDEHVYRGDGYWHCIEAQGNHIVLLQSKRKMDFRMYMHEVHYNRMGNK